MEKFNIGDTSSNLYICDPNKNTECKKTDCLYLGKGYCYRTTNKKFSKSNDTNQDKVAEFVRTMKPENLAEYLSDDIFVCEQNCPIHDKYGYDRCPEGVTCKEAILKWLKEEV